MKWTRQEKQIEWKEKKKKNLSCKQRRFMDLPSNLWTPEYFLIKPKQQTKLKSETLFFGLCIGYMNPCLQNWCDIRCYWLRDAANDEIRFFFSLFHIVILLLLFNAHTNQIGIFGTDCIFIWWDAGKIYNAFKNLRR